MSSIKPKSPSRRKIGFYINWMILILGVFAAPYAHGALQYCGLLIAGLLLVGLNHVTIMKSVSILGGEKRKRRQALDYGKMYLLDAETLAEVGIKETYQSLLKVLGQYVSEPAQVQEFVDNHAPSYVVRCGDREYVIYSPALPEDEGQSWGRAAHAFFKIINDQLTKSEYRFYAINGANDLGGMFLTQAECEAARKSLPRKEDWPYLPTPEHPWYGQYHS